MSEISTNIKQNPESYSSKDKPEIINIKENAAKNGQDLQLPSEYIIIPKDKIAAFSGDRWPFSNVEPAVYGALGLFYGRTQRRDNNGALINNDIEYAIHNVLTGHAFGLFYCLPDFCLSMAVYGFSSYRPEISDYSEEEIITIIKDQIYRGNAVHIDEGNGPYDYLIWGYKDNGNILIGYKFEHGNDMVNCSYDFENPSEFLSLTKGFSDTALYQPNGERRGGITFIRPDGEKLNRDLIYKNALAEGYRMLTQTEPPSKIDIERVHFGYGKAIYDAWIRQLEQANTENSGAFYFSSPIFPHFIALYENRLQLYKFLKTYAETCGDENLFKAADICEQLKNLAQDGAQIGFENEWSDPKILALTNNERRNLLINLLNKCRMLEVEIAEFIKVFIDAPQSYSPKDKPEIISIAKQKSARIISTENGKYIDNIPAIKWGEWRDCTYSGCMTLLLNALGEKTTYEQIMGLTGSCYRVSMVYGWDPGSSIVNIVYFHLSIDSDRNANRYYGIESTVAHEFIKNDNNEKSVSEEREKLIKESIDSGIPVLILGSRTAPEWGIVLGYEMTTDGMKYFGRSYFDENAPEEELFTSNRYVLANRFPKEVEYIKLYNQSCEPTTALDALKISLETCLKMFTPNDRIGYGAYEFIINGLNNNEYGHICNIFGNLLDARRAAYIYLEQSAQLLSGENKIRLTNISAMYKEIYNLLFSVLPYDKLYDNEFELLSAEIRKDIVDSLQKIVALEKQVRIIVQEIFEKWNEK
ncbi:MAG: hypothetical protein ACYCWE_06450 [Eubacteriales bacterium]